MFNAQGEIWLAIHHFEKVSYIFQSYLLSWYILVLSNVFFKLGFVFFVFLGFVFLGSDSGPKFP